MMISRRQILKAAVAASASCITVDTNCFAQKREHAMNKNAPNILILLTDDQGYGDMSCHGHPILKTPNMDRLHDESVRLTDFHVTPMCAPSRGELMSGVHCLRNGAMATSLGRHLLDPELPTMPSLFADAGYGNAAARTPHLDQLARQGLRFTDFHSNGPMCSPTRAALLTGRYQQRLGIESALPTRWDCRGLARPENRGEITVASRLGEAGYATGIFGKWHLGDSYPYRPMDRGFQEAVYFHGFGLTGADSYWCNDYLDPYYRHNGEVRQAKGYCTGFWFDSAMDWMATQDRPFLCYIPTNVPHFPMWVDDVYKEEFAAYGEKPEGFFGMIKELDENLGRLEAFLAKQGLRDNTIVIFMTDNGHAGGALDVYNAGMRGGKCSRYEGGHRVPCFIRWPGGDLLQKTALATPTHGRDILPTLLELCGIDAPANAVFDGQSLAPLLRGQEHDLDRRISVIQYYQNAIAKDDACVLQGPWRLVFGNQLFNIKDDPGQKRDIAAEHPDTVARLKAHYDAWWAGVEPGLEKLNAVTIGSPHEAMVTLTSCEWDGVRCDGAGSVRSAASKDKRRRGGPWHIHVDRPGRYRIELCRWPKESGLALDAPAPTFEAAYGDLEPGVALPIARAVLKHAGREAVQETEAGASGAVFELDLPAGRTTLHGWFRDAEGKDLSGAFYAYIHRN